MEPKLPTPDRGLNIPSINYSRGGEHLPLTNPETTIERHVEHVEQKSEVAPGVQVTPVLPPPVVAPAPPPAVQDDTGAATTANPLVANDDDLIEKEWVMRAKEIIVQTKDDPYRRELEVGKLQADYLRKRYGRELGASQ